MKKIAILTSGGDAPGMNAAVRAVVRGALAEGLEVYVIYEGFRGMVDGGQRIRLISWQDVGGILHQGGTIIGSARCDAFRKRAGRRQAVFNLLQHGIDNLVVVGGDGSLTGANILQQEWPDLISELVTKHQLEPGLAEKHDQLTVVGLAGTIDNDVWGTDMAIGTDTALHRIIYAVDTIASTAASHQRAFVVEVMGRNCGYLALMSALASGADWVLVPENPPDLDNWEDKMCEVLRNGREQGRRDSIVVLAEGARDRHGQLITSNYIKQVLQERLAEDVRVTILGHVQRGGSPSVFDRNLSTLLGVTAVATIIDDVYHGQAQFIGVKANRIVRIHLSECLAKTNQATEAVRQGDFELARTLRGSSFQECFQTVRTLLQAQPHEPKPEDKHLRIAVMNAGGPAPGMNTAVRAAVRLGLDKGHQMLGVDNGFQGLIQNDIQQLNWMSVSGWAPVGGSELGTNRHIPAHRDFYAIARNFEEHDIQGLLIIGGWSAYTAALALYNQQTNFRAFDIPIICLPATIDNDLPGTELSVGADTALNSIIEAVDKIKQSAVASGRVFVVEVMGRKCGYLALMSAQAAGAERVYLHEEGVFLKDLQADVQHLIEGFNQGKRLGLVIRSEGANSTYSTDFICALFKEEGGNLFTVRQAILGHLQQGGNPTPFDRILASRLAAKCITYLEEQLDQPKPKSACIGLSEGGFHFTDLEGLPKLIDKQNGRPVNQWWLDLLPVAQIMAQPAPGENIA